MIRIPVSAALAALSLLLAAGIAPADPRTERGASTRSLLIFGGETVRDHVWEPESLPFRNTSGHQVQFGAALSDLPLDLPWGFRAGVEVGLSWRRDGDGLGRAGSSAELWAGPALRHRGIALGPILLRPGLAVGYSLVTESNGLERRREIDEDGNARLLYFMAPEISVALADRPGIDFVYRVQHRSGGKNVGLPPLGNLGDVTNANVFGLRWRF